MMRKDHDRLPLAEADRLGAITRSVRFVWVLGNHDPAPPRDLGGESVVVFAARHSCSVTRRKLGASGELSGHYHPKAAIPARGGAVSRPCFIADQRRMILPAFGAYAGGLDVRDPAILRLFPRGGRVFLLGRDRLFSFAI